MKYERLTKYKRGDLMVNCNNCEYEFCDSVSCTPYNCYNAVLNRLAELEDKIENETLIELGYHIRKSYKNHDDQRYKIILIDEVEKIVYDHLTKAEAEKKLKELKE